MTVQVRRRGITIALIAGSLALLSPLVTGCGSRESQQGITPANDDDKKTLEDFEARVKQYADLHREQESTLPALPKEASPEQIDQNQRALGALIQKARAAAKQGDIFTPAMQALVRRSMDKVFAGQAGAERKGSVMDENPVGLKIDVNERYPDTVPLSTMPPDVLAFLPKMPEELEYRFVGNNLVILDVHAHLVADFVPDVINR